MNSSVAAIAQVLNQSQLSTIVNWFPGIFLCEKEVRDKLKKNLGNHISKNRTKNQTCYLQLKRPQNILVKAYHLGAYESSRVQLNNQKNQRIFK